jgi:phospholipid/cholesterol/gamma-HCH transport system substrate-binding protein
MADVANLVPNSEVKLNDVTVGTVLKIAVNGWHASLTVGLEKEVKLPRNATAKIGQKSLLGAEYLELSGPRVESPQGQLRDGDTIPLSNTGRYPETEEVLAALSVVLNGGGLGQLRTITTELNQAFGGREGQIRELIDNLNEFSETLNDQRSNIVQALDGLDALSSRLNAQKDVLAASVDELPRGLAVLNDEREQLVDALSAVDQLGVVSKRVIDGSKSDLIANLHALAPTLGKLADAGHNIAGSLLLLPTYPWADSAFPAIAKGDYINIFMTVDLSPDMLARNFGIGFSMPKVPFLSGLPPLGAGQGHGNPLEMPFLPSASRPMVPGTTLHGAGDSLGRQIVPSPAGSTRSSSPTPGTQRDFLPDALGGGR